MAQEQDFDWDQGSDLSVKLIYKEGATTETAVAIDLSANYAVRMDIVVPATLERVYTFNSATISDVDPVVAGDQPDNTLEAVLTSGGLGTPNINITVPRALTLPGGAIYAKMKATTPVKIFNYDVFLRNSSTNKQVKILTGQIEIIESYTLWL